MKKGSEKKYTVSSGETKNIRLPRHQAQLSIWNIGLGILGVDIQIKLLQIQSLINPTNALWKDLILHRLNLILNSNHSPF